MISSLKCLVSLKKIISFPGLDTRFLIKKKNKIFRGKKKQDYFYKRKNQFLKSYSSNGIVRKVFTAIFVDIVSNSNLVKRIVFNSSCFYLEMLRSNPDFLLYDSKGSLSSENQVIHGTEKIRKPRVSFFKLEKLSFDSDIFPLYFSHRIVSSLKRFDLKKDNPGYGYPFSILPISQNLSSNLTSLSLDGRSFSSNNFIFSINQKILKSFTPCFPLSKSYDFLVKIPLLNLGMVLKLFSLKPMFLHLEVHNKIVYFNKKFGKNFYNLVSYQLIQKNQKRCLITRYNFNPNTTENQMV